MQYEKGHYYHIYNRGNNRQDIFLEERNYEYLEQLFAKNTERYELTIIAYCLMPNHYHLLLRQESDLQISQFIRSTFQSYVQAINKAYNRSGRLFEKQGDGKEVDDKEYLLHVCRYIHLNPLEAGLVDELENWQYSNYPEFIGIRNGTLFARSLINEWFESGEDYRQFVMDYVEEKNRYQEIQKYLFE